MHIRGLSFAYYVQWFYPQVPLAYYKVVTFVIVMTVFFCLTSVAVFSILLGVNVKTASVPFVEKHPVPSIDVTERLALLPTMTFSLAEDFMIPLFL